MQLATLQSMTTTLLAHLREEAMKLSKPERRELARSLVVTLDDDPEIDDDNDDVDVHPEWRAEIERRVAAIRNGTARSVPAADVIAELLARSAR